METSNVILEYLKVILNWPLIIFIIVFIMFKWFREPISVMLRNVRNITTPYGSIAVDPGAQREEIKTSNDYSSESDIRNFVKNNPEKVIHDYMQLFNSYRYERSFNLIYGSQVNLLNYLSRKSDKRENYIKLYDFYLQYAGKGGLETYQFADYMGFLLDAQFIKNITESNGAITVEITPIGLNFLTYIKGQYPSAYNSKPY